MIASTNTWISIGRLLRISRPRFWIYVLWPVIVYFAGSGLLTRLYHTVTSQNILAYIGDIVMIAVVIWYFTLPANLWIYGWNDIADEDTDTLNEKKWAYEENIHTQWIQYKKSLKKHIRWWNIWYIVIWSLIIAITTSIFAWYQQEIIWNPWPIFPRWITWGILCLIAIGYLLPFWITAYLYSCLPLRAKAKPFIDGIMNILYIITPIMFALLPLSISYTSSGNIETIIFACIAGWLRCMAMHCYSAIPDIIPDAQAWLKTTAVYLGKQKALIYCGILYGLAALLSYPILWVGSIIWGVIYLTMIIVSYRKQDIFWLYKIFPYINFAVGFWLFWWLILKA